MTEVKEMIKAAAKAAEEEDLIREMSDMDPLDSEQEDYVVGDKKESKRMSTERFMKQT